MKTSYSTQRAVSEVAAQRQMEKKILTEGIMVYGFLNDPRITNEWLGSNGPPGGDAGSGVVYRAVEAAITMAGGISRATAAVARPLAGRILWRNVRARSIRQLQGLDDALLRDIGIERDAIPQVVDELMQPQTAPDTARPRPGPIVGVPLRAQACCPA